MKFLAFLLTLTVALLPTPAAASNFRLRTVAFGVGASYGYGGCAAASYAVPAVALAPVVPTVAATPAYGACETPALAPALVPSYGYGAAFAPSFSYGAAFAPSYGFGATPFFLRQRAVIVGHAPHVRAFVPGAAIVVRVRR